MAPRPQIFLPDVDANGELIQREDYLAGKIIFLKDQYKEVKEENKRL